MPFAVVNGEPISQHAARPVHPAAGAGGVPGGLRGPARPAAVPDPPPEPRHPRHPAGGDHPPVHAVHRADAGPAAGARRGIPGDGRDAGGDQITHAAAAAAAQRGGRGSIRAPNSCGACRSTSASSAPPRASTSSTRLERDVWPAVRAPQGAPGRARAAAADAAGDAARLQGRGGALADVRPPPHPARAALGAASA